MAGNFDNIRFTCSWCPGQVALIMLLSIMLKLFDSDPHILLNGADCRSTLFFKEEEFTAGSGKVVKNSDPGMETGLMRCSDDPACLCIL